MNQSVFHGMSSKGCLISGGFRNCPKKLPNSRCLGGFFYRRVLKVAEVFTDFLSFPMFSHVFHL